MSRRTLEQHRRLWEKKPVIRRLYRQWYRRLCNQLSGEGRVLEIGAGPGQFKTHCPGVFCSDYTWCPWLDVVLDAHQLPFAQASFSDLVLVDVLHHLAAPLRFFSEALRVLVPGGRLIMLEPCITPWSWPVYRFLHPETVDFHYDVFSGQGWGGPEKDPFEGNMAIASKLFGLQRKLFKETFPDFKLVKKECSDFLLYPLSGGYSHSSLIPEQGIPLVMRIEQCLRPLSPLLAYRMLVVLEKR